MDDFQSQMLERLVRMETKLDLANTITISHDARLKSLEDNSPHPDHEARIRKLERVIWLAVGAAAAGGGVLGALFNNLGI